MTEVARLQEAECDTEVVGMTALRRRWLQQRLTETIAATQRVELFLHGVRVVAAGADELTLNGGDGMGTCAGGGEGRRGRRTDPATDRQTTTEE